MSDQYSFRFRKVVNGGSRRGANGWQVEGCYCQDGSRCSCAGNRNRVKMVSKEKINLDKLT